MKVMMVDFTATSFPAAQMLVACLLLVSPHILQVSSAFRPAASFGNHRGTANVLFQQEAISLRQKAIIDTSLQMLPVPPQEALEQLMCLGTTLENTINIQTNDIPTLVFLGSMGLTGIVSAGMSPKTTAGEDTTINFNDEQVTMNANAATEKEDFAVSNVMSASNKENSPFGDLVPAAAMASTTMSSLPSPCVVLAADSTTTMRNTAIRGGRSSILTLSLEANNAKSAKRALDAFVVSLLHVWSSILQAFKNNCKISKINSGLKEAAVALSAFFVVLKRSSSNLTAKSLTNVKKLSMSAKTKIFNSYTVTSKFMRPKIQSVMTATEERAVAMKLALGATMLAYSKSLSRFVSETGTTLEDWTGIAKSNIKTSYKDTAKVLSPVLRISVAKMKNAIVAAQVVAMTIVLSTYQALIGSIGSVWQLTQEIASSTKDWGTKTLASTITRATTTLRSSPAFFLTCAAAINEYSVSSWKACRQWMVSFYHLLAARFQRDITILKTTTTSASTALQNSTVGKLTSKMKTRLKESSQKASQKMAKKSRILTKFADRAYQREYREHHKNDSLGILQVKPVVQKRRFETIKDQIAMVKSNYIDAVPAHMMKFASSIAAHRKALPNPKALISKWKERRNEAKFIRLTTPTMYPKAKKQTIRLSESKAARLATKYSKMESAEERAYHVLVDLGMVVPTR